MATNQNQRGGRRSPPGGRPAKNHVKWFCYLPPEVVPQIDAERGTLTRGEFLLLLWANWQVSERPG